MNKIKVEIWSDIVCPFCYIGKRRLENALHEFQHRNEVEINWRSYLLDPTLITQPSKNALQHLADKKGWSLAHASQMVDHVTRMAEQCGLNYNLEKSVVANSFDAHRLIQLAKQENKGDTAEELLFRAYFTEAKNIADISVLIDIAENAGISREKAEQVMSGEMYSAEVLADVNEARQMGIRGVPYFLFNNTLAVSGAQDKSVFLSALEKSLLQIGGVTR